MSGQQVEAHVIRVPRIAGSRGAARKLCADVVAGVPVVLEFRDNRTSPPSFVHELLFYATVPPANANRVIVRNASPEVIEAAQAWLDAATRRVRRAVTIERQSTPQQVEARTLSGLDIDMGCQCPAERCGNPWASTCIGVSAHAVEWGVRYGDVDAVVSYGAHRQTAEQECWLSGRELVSRNVGTERWDLVTATGRSEP